jgi:hypothetical protein
MKERVVNWLLAVVVATTTGSARAQTPMPSPSPCQMKAREHFISCMGQCRETVTAERLACRNVDPTCGEACLAGRQACLDQVQTILTSGALPDGTDVANCSGGTDACKATFHTARQACIDASCPIGKTCSYCEPSDQTCTACVDQAQVTDFTCRDACYDSWNNNAVVMSLRESCRKGFQSCLATCPANQ